MRMPGPAWGPLIRGYWVRARPAVTLCVCLGVSWLLYLAQNGQWSLFLWVPAIYLGIRRRWMMLAVFLICMPLTAEFGRAACEYAAGTRRFVKTNDAYEYRFNIDPITRVRSRADEYDASDANTWVWRLAEDTAEWVMYWIIGPPPGAYDGPYPTEAEARATIDGAGAATVLVGNTARPTLSVGGRSAPINTDVLDHWGFVLSEDQRRLAPGNVRQPVRAALVGGRCAVVAWPHAPESVDPLIELILIDMNTGRIFARYVPHPPMQRTTK
jgi:hypothetical protein